MQKNVLPRKMNFYGIQFSQFMKLPPWSSTSVHGNNTPASASELLIGDPLRLRLVVQALELSKWGSISARYCYLHRDGTEALR